MNIGRVQNEKKWGMGGMLKLSCKGGIEQQWYSGDCTTFHKKHLIYSNIYQKLFSLFVEIKRRLKEWMCDSDVWNWSL